MTQQDNAPVTLEFFARAENLADVRRLIEPMGSKTPLSRADMDELLTAADEAAANAIRHGSPRGEKDLVRVVCHSLPKGLIVEIKDSGSGFHAPSNPSMPGPEAQGGRGLPLMCALADSIEIMSGDKGTTVTLKKIAR